MALLISNQSVKVEVCAPGSHVWRVYCYADNVEAAAPAIERARGYYGANVRVTHHSLMSSAPASTRAPRSVRVAA